MVSESSKNIICPQKEDILDEEAKLFDMQREGFYSKAVEK